MIDLTAFQQLILLSISIREEHNEQTPHGLAIKEDLTTMYQRAGKIDEDEEVNHGRLYPNLDTLVDEGHLEKKSRDKRTNEYELTAEGRDAVDAFSNLVDLAIGEDASNPYAPSRQPISAD